LHGFSSLFSGLLVMINIGLAVFENAFRKPLLIRGFSAT